MKGVIRKSVVSMLILSLVLLLGASAEAKTEITLWTLFGGGEGSIMTDLVKQFNEEHPDIVLEEQIIEWAQYYNKLMTGLLSGEAPDVGIMHLAVLPDYASRGVLNAIEDGVPEGFTDKFLPNIIEKAQLDGHLFAIPIDTHPLVMYYNKAVLQEAGIAEDKMVPTTWDELMANAKQVKENTGKWGLTLETSAMFGERWWIGVYTQLGAAFLDPESGALSVDVEKAAKAYEILTSFAKAGVQITPADYPECESLFTNNESAYHFNGVWAMSVYPNTEGLDFGVSLIPGIEAGRSNTWGDSHSLIFPKKGDDEKLKAALTFGQWFSEKTVAWAKAGHLPVNKAVMGSEEFLNLPFRKDYVAVGETAVLAPSVRGWSQIREEMWEIGQRALAEELDPQAAAEELKMKIEEISEQ